MFNGAEGRLVSTKGASYLGESGGMPPQDIFEIAHSETLFPAFLEPNNQFPRQGWPEFPQILFKKDNFQ